MQRSRLSMIIAAFGLMLLVWAGADGELYRILATATRVCLQCLGVG